MSSIAENPDSELSQPKTGWKLFCRLASGEITPGRACRNPAYRRKFILRSFDEAICHRAIIKRPGASASASGHA